MASNHVVGNVGLYFAAYRLSQMGWNVMPTSRNARGIGLLAYDAPAGRYLLAEHAFAATQLAQQRDVVALKLWWANPSAMGQTATY